MVAAASHDAVGLGTVAELRTQRTGLTGLRALLSNMRVFYIALFASFVRNISPLTIEVMTKIPRQPIQNIRLTANVPKLCKRAVSFTDTSRACSARRWS